MYSGDVVTNVVHQCDTSSGSMGSMIMHSVPGDGDGSVMRLNPLIINLDKVTSAVFLKHLLAEWRRSALRSALKNSFLKLIALEV